MGSVERWRALAVLTVATLNLCSVSHAHSTPADCHSPKNRIVEENCRSGAPASEWDVNGAGDPTIQGFATDISVNVGERVEFKIKTDAPKYRLDIYR